MKLQILFVLFIFGPVFAFAQPPVSNLESIFNGKNFKNWVKPKKNKHWKVDKGILSATSGPDKKGSILWTKKSFKDFVVELDFKMGKGTVDSGIFMRGDGPDAPQIQIGISGSLKRDMTGSPYVPKQGYPVEASNIPELLLLGEWNTMRAKAVGNTFMVWLNGEEVMTYVLKGAKLEGPVGLQLHPNRDMSIEFRNIKLAELE